MFDAGPQTPLLEVDVGVFLSAMLFLPSTDVFRLRGACTGLSTSLPDGADSPRRFRRSLATTSRDGASGAPALGSLGRRGVWLHALLDARRVKACLEGLRRFNVMGELVFWQASEVFDMLAALDFLDEKARSAQPDKLAKRAGMNVGFWSFAADEVAALSRGSRQQPVRSEPVRFRGAIGAGGIDLVFDVRLVLSVSAFFGTWALSWEPTFLGNLEPSFRGHGPEVFITGCLSVPGIAETVSCSTSAIVGSFARCSRASLALQGPIRAALQEGRSMMCLLRVGMRCASYDWPVTLVDDKNAQENRAT